MKGLKKTLTKVEPPKMAKNSTMKVGNKSKKSTWQDLHSLIQFKSPAKFSVEAKLENQIIGVIQQAYKLNGLSNFSRVLDEVKKKIYEPESRHKNLSQGKFQKNQFENEDENINQMIKGIFEKNGKQIGWKSMESLKKFDYLLTRYINRKIKIERREKVEEFDRLIRVLSPKNYGSKVERRKQISNMRSPGNFKVKVTREEYEIKQNGSQKSLTNSQKGESEKLRKMMKSASIQKGRQRNLSSAKSDDGFNRLRKLMGKSKDGSVKVIKTKVQYDYSAIFQASKTKVKPRYNKNMTHDPTKNENSMSSKLNKVKKNQAFVFYRPETKVGIGMGIPKKQKDKKKNKGISLHGFIANQ